MPKKLMANDDGTLGLHRPPDGPSRTKQKRTAEALQKTGEQLLTLSDGQIEALGISPELRQAVVEARAMIQHGARRRQLQYIGTLMRGPDGPRIQQQLEAMAQQSSTEARRFKQAELWRDELKAGNTQRFEWLLEQFPNLDQKQLAALVHDTQHSHAASARKAGRMLFRFLRQLADERDSNQGGIAGRSLYNRAL
jgi:ribosome-associated protein